MKLISWNVNGVRSILRKGFADFVEQEDPDVVCLQETKASSTDIVIPQSLAGYNAFWNLAERKGYSGTAIFTKSKPIEVTFGIGIPEHDREGRVIKAEYPEFFLISVYVPNSKRDLSRLGYRQIWDRDFLRWLKKLETRKPVIFCGDLNVAHTEIDLARPKGNEKNHGFTPEERAGFDALVGAGFVDTFRVFEKAGGHYTWWSQMSNARARNIGWRIDYFLVSEALRSALKAATIYHAIAGSDHCPVGIELKKRRAAPK